MSSVEYYKGVRIEVSQGSLECIPGPGSRYQVYLNGKPMVARGRSGRLITYETREGALAGARRRLREEALT